MKYTNLGDTGLSVSRICLGIMSYGNAPQSSWILSEEEGRPHIQAALEAGINFFDTAEVYSNGSSEEILGRAIKDFADHREDVVIATKVFGGTQGQQARNRRGLSRKHILSEVDASLERLQTDYIDVYQTHRWDYNTPIEETLEAMNDCVRAGKVRYIGASSMFAWQFERALNVSEQNGWAKFVSMQNHYNLIYREEECEMNPLCRDRGVGLIPWSPLAGGKLAKTAGQDKTARQETREEDGRDPNADKYFYDSDQQIIGAVRTIAENRGLEPAQVALAWILAQPGVTAPIIGATKPHHLTAAIGAVDVELTEEETAQLTQAYIPHPVVGALAVT